MRRGQVIMLIAAVLVLGAIPVIVAGPRENPYQFLERYHPRHVAVAESGEDPDLVSILVFNPVYREDILRDIRAESTRPEGPPTGQNGDPADPDIYWPFCKGAAYAYGGRAFRVMAAAENGTRPPSMFFADGFIPSGKACIVMISEKRGWFDQVTARARSVLHL